MKRKKILIFLVALIGVFSLTSCDAESFSENLSSSIIHALIPNFWGFITQFLALIVLIVLVGLFAYKPLRKFMDSRSEFLDNEVKTATKNNNQSKLNLQESEKSIADSRKAAMDIVNEAKITANTEKKRIIGDADTEVLKMKDMAQKDIERSKYEAQKSIKDEIVNVALDASKQVLGREVNKEDNERIVNSFMDEIDKAKNEKNGNN